MTDETTPTTPRARPTIHDETVLRAAVDRHMPEILAWCDEDDADDEERERIVQHFVSAMEGENDAYEVCRDLDLYHGYCPDRELVDLVDRVLRRRHDALDAAERAWVAEVQPAITFEVGDHVTWHRIRMCKAGTYTGEVIKVDAERARLHVFCEELGHMRPGERRSGTLAAIVNIEDA